jgi:hypothetical protein
LLDERLDVVLAGVRDDAEANVPAALDRADDHGLVLAVAPTPCRALAADQGLVNLDHADQRRLFDGPHGVPDPVAQVPAVL